MNPETLSDLDLALGRDLPEDDAFQAFQALQSNGAHLDEPIDGTGETMRRQATETLRSYTERSRAYDRPLFPKATAKANAQRNEFVRGLFTKDLVDVLPPEKHAILEARAKHATDPDAYRARQVLKSYLAQTTGAKISPRKFDFARQRFAKQLGMKGDLSDKSVFAEIQQRYREHDNTTKGLATIGNYIDEKVFSPDPEANDPAVITRRINELVSEFPERLQDDARLELLNHYRKTRDLKRTTKPIADRFIRYIGFTHIFRGKEAVEATDPQTMEQDPEYLEQAVDDFLKLSPEEQSATAHHIHAALEHLPDKDGIFQRIQETIARSTSSLGNSALQGLRSLFFTASAQAAGIQPEESGNFADFDARFQARATLLQGAQAAPLFQPSDSWSHKAVLGASSQIPTLGMIFAGPSGLGLLGTSMAGDSVQGQRLETPDAPFASQVMSATASGAAQLGLEYTMTRAGLRLIKGRAPTIAGVLSKNGIRNAYARSAIAFPALAAGAAATEYSEEIAQAATDRVLADVTRELAGYDANTNWKSFFADWMPNSGTRQSEETLAAILPFALLGSGAVGSYSHFRHGQWLQQSKTVLKAVGIPEARIEAIQQAEPQEAAKLTQEAFQEGLEEVQAEQRTAALDVLREAATLYQEAGYPIVFPETNDFTEETAYIFQADPFDPSTRRTFETEEEALTAFQQAALDMESDALDAITEAARETILDTLAGEGTAAEADVDFIPLDTTAPSITRAADIKDAFGQPIATPDQIRARVQEFLVQGGQRKDVPNLIVKAKRIARKLRNGTTRQVVQYFKDSDPIALMEDTAESLLDQGITEGFLEPADIVRQLRAVESATGNRYLAEGYDPATGNRMPLLEAFSAFARDYVFTNLRSQQLPDELRSWVSATAVATGQGFAYAKELARVPNVRAAIEEGRIDAGFQAMVGDMLGMNAEEIDARLQAKYEAELAAEAMEGFPEIGEAAKAKLPHPQTLRDAQHPLTGEVQRLYDGLKRPTRRKKKNGDPVENTRAANAYFLPYGEMIDLDNVRAALNEDGFAFDTIQDMLAALDGSLNYQIPTHATATLQDEETTSFALGSPSSNPYESIHEAHAPAGAQGTPRPQGSLAPEISEALEQLARRTEEQRDQAVLGAGNENIVSRLTDTLVVKTPTERGFFTYAPEGGLIRSHAPAVLHAKAEVLRALDGLPTSAVTTAGRLLLIQDLGTPISLSEYEAIELPGGIRPAQTPAFRLQIEGREFLVSDLNQENFLKDRNGVVRLSDPIVGQVNPGAGFLPDIDDASFSITPAQDAAYMEAVEAGDMATAQAMVDQAAKAAGYHTRARHGTAEKFDAFSHAEGGRMTDAQSARKAFFLTDDDATAQSYAIYAAEAGPVKAALRRAEEAERRGDWDGYDEAIIEAEQLDTYEATYKRRENAIIVDAYLSGDFLEFDAQGKTPQELHAEDIDAGITAQIHKAQAQGKDGVVYRNLDDAIDLADRPATHFAVFKPSQIKSADPVTYDEAGNPVPLSERFNPQDDRISFAIGEHSFAPGSGSREITVRDTTLTFSLSKDGTTGEVILVKTPQDKRGQGSAREALTLFTEEADKRGVTLFLTPEPMDTGITKTGLQRFYRSLGFKPNKGRNKDFRSMATMVREPSGSSSLALSPANLNRLEAVIAKKLTEGPAERADYYERVRNRLAGTLIRFTENAPPLNQTETEKETQRIREAIAEAKAIIQALPADARGRIALPAEQLIAAKTQRGKVTVLKQLIADADAALETIVARDYLEAITKLIDLAKPDVNPHSKQARGRLTPKTQRAVSQILEVIDQDPATIEADLFAIDNKIEEIDNKLADPATTAEQTKKLVTERVAHELHRVRVDTFGALSKQSAAELAHAFETLESLYRTGRLERNIYDDAQRQEREAMRRDVVDSLPPVDQTKWATTTAKDGIAELVNAWKLGHYSFHQFMESIFPNSTTARHFQTQARKAETGFRRAMIDSRQRWANWARETFDLPARGWHRKLNKILADLSVRKDHGIEIAEGVSFHNEKLTPEQAEAILRGDMKVGWHDDLIAITSLRQALADFKLARAKDQSRAEFVRFQRLKSRGKKTPFLASDLEILYLLQLSSQPQYLPALDKYGFTRDVLDKLVHKIDPHALAIGDHLATEYAAEYDRLNPVFQRLYGFDMPQIRNYAPGMFENMTAGNTRLDPDSGVELSANAMAAGFTKNRTHHMARPRQENALNVYWSHIHATEYFIHWAELVRDMRAVFNHPTVRRAIQGNYGKDVAIDFSRWLEALELDGNFPEVMNRASAKLAANIALTTSAVGLAFNVGSVLKQSQAALNGLLQMSVTDSIQGIMAVARDPSIIRKTWHTEAIQQRVLEGMNPEDRRLLEAAKAKPSQVLEAYRIGRAPLAWGDAAATTLYAAVAYGHHYQAAKKQKLTDQQAEDHALRIMDDVVKRTAQPATTQDKSLSELTAGRWGHFIGYIFRSDPRQKLAISMKAWEDLAKGRIDKPEALRKTLVGWIIYGIMNEVMGDVWQAISRDEDDEDRWAPRDYLAAAIAGPLSGGGVMGALAEAAIRGTIGTDWYGGSTAAADVVRLTNNQGSKTLKTLLDDTDSTMSEVLKAALSAARAYASALGAIEPRIGIFAVGARTLRDGAGIITNLTPTEADRQDAILRTYKQEQKDARAERAEQRAAEQGPQPRLTPQERQLKGLSSQHRADAIKEITAPMTPTERTAYLDRLQDIGLLTPTVQSYLVAEN